MLLVIQVSLQVCAIHRRWRRSTVMERTLTETLEACSKIKKNPSIVQFSMEIHGITILEPHLESLARRLLGHLFVLAIRFAIGHVNPQGIHELRDLASGFVTR